MIQHSKPTIGSEEINAASRVLASGQLNSGAESIILGKQIASDSGYADAIGVPSASLGIYIILKYRFPKGNARVALSSYICRSVYDAVKMADCIPVLYDIDINTFAIDVAKIDLEKTDIVIVAHLFGIRADFSYLLEKGVEVIEDCAQRIIPTYITSEVKPDWRVYSFEPTKLITCGQGGIIAGKNEMQLLDIRNFIGGSYDFKDYCMKAPFTDLQAAIAFEQWKKLNSFLEKRKKITQYYIEQLSLHNLAHLVHRCMFSDDTWAFRFVLKVESIEKIMNQMFKLGVICRRPVNPCGLHQLFNFPGSFNSTEKALDEIISIPIYPSLIEKEQEHIIFSFIQSYEA